MPRIRSIKPEFCSSEAIAGPTGLTIPCRLHFAMLWTYADDEGRGVDNPRLIKAALWPLDDEITASQVEAWQDELEAKGRIRRYEAGGRRYFVTTNFKEHQKPSKPLPSKLPEPPPQGGGGLPEDSRNGSAPSEESSDPPADDSRNEPGGLSSVVGGEKEREREGEHSGTGPPLPESSPASPAPARVLALVEPPPDPLPPEPDAPLLPVGFDAFWARWPRRRNRSEAHQAWKAARGRGAPEHVILAGADTWAAYWQAEATEERYIPHAATWLRREQWAEDPPEVTRRPARPGTDRKTDQLRSVLTDFVNGETA